MQSSFFKSQHHKAESECGSTMTVPSHPIDEDDLETKVRVEMPHPRVSIAAIPFSLKDLACLW